MSVETIRLTALDTYCQDRDAKLMELCEEDNMTKSEAKMLFIKSLNTEYKVTKQNKKKLKTSSSSGLMRKLRLS